MLGLPTTTEVNRQLPKTLVYKQFGLTTQQRDRFDVDISRMAIVKRIKQYAGEEFSYEDFKANDVVSNDAATRSFDNLRYSGGSVHNYQLPPKIHKGSPLGNKKNK